MSELKYHKYYVRRTPSVARLMQCDAETNELMTRRIFRAGNIAVMTECYKSCWKAFIWRDIFSNVWSECWKQKPWGLLMYDAFCIFKARNTDLELFWAHELSESPACVLQYIAVCLFVRVLRAIRAKYFNGAKILACVFRKFLSRRIVAFSTWELYILEIKN